MNRAFPRMASATMLIVAFSYGCQPDSVGVKPAGVPSAMVIVAGDTQQVTVNTELPNALVVRVTDDEGTPVPNQVVNFRVTAGGGSVFAGAAITNVNGIAQERWRVGTVAADTQRLEARAVDANTGAPLTFAVFKATALAGPATKLAKSSPDAGQYYAGSAVSAKPRVQVTDQFDNPVAGAAVIFSVTAGGGTATGTTQTTDAGGFATVGGWTLGSVVGANTLTAAVTGLTGAGVSFTATAINGARIAVTTAPSGAQNRVPFSTQPVLQVLDTLGNPVAQSGVSVTATGSGLSGTTALATGSSGSLSFTDLVLAGAVGSKTITFSATGFASVSSTIALTAGTAASISAVAGSDQAAAEGTTVVVPPAVRVADADNNPVAGTIVSFAVASGGGSITGATPTSDASGVATIGSWTMGLSAAVNTLTASVTGLAGSPQTFSAYAAFKAKQIAPGIGHTCALDMSGAAWCWGGNNVGQLGDGTNTARSTAVAVLGGRTYTSIASHDGHTCGITVADGTFCWGAGTLGQLGDGSQTPRTSPVAVGGAVSFKQLATGVAVTCGISVADTTYCWGSEQFSGSASSPYGTYLTPTPISGTHVFTTISAANTHACGLKSDGTAFCWGNNADGKLGDGTTAFRDTPVAMLMNGKQLQSIELGSTQSCGVDAAGAAYCWGFNQNGEIGDGTTVTRTTITAVAGGLVFQSVSAGNGHACGLTTTGTAHCWGQNSLGELGDATRTERWVPTAVSGGLVFKQLVAGLDHTCGITSSDAVYCWGRNDVGQLGNGTTTQNGNPTPGGVRKP